MTGADKLTLGPVLYNWAPDKWRDFYYRIADEAAVDTVCLGEVVCAKRAPFLDPVIPEVAERLARAGKEVIFSTLALVMNQRELEGMRALAADAAFLIEANDISAVALMEGRPFTVGPFINVYNEATLAYLAGLGAMRVCLPVEMPADSIAVLARADACPLEVQVFGRLPLALSARCYHARNRGLHKDSCQFVCAEDPDGMVLETLDGAPFLAVNGTQTLSYTYANLALELDALRAMGVRRFRLNPQDIDMVAVAATFRDILDGREGARAGTRRLALISGDVPFSNGFFHGVEGVSLRV